ncbi:MAG: lipoate--protein ligase family protein [Candidatus Omnitrophica bacterium]|nr:lipoate--protein ligase family protein [Candidatus Omnitrophota bacterium]
MEKRWRLIVDKKKDGYYNMAVDEAILLNYQTQRVPTLRIYGWSEPFITLGYSQEPNEVLELTNKLPFLKRVTGGSAILHDRELTYSITCVLEDLSLTSSVKESYKTICSFLINFYQSLGISVKYAKDTEETSLDEQTPFCFSSWQKLDLVAADKKIGGNAQRRKRNLIFQHGSIPQELDFSIIDKAIKTPFDVRKRATSLEQLLGHHTDFSSLSQLLAKSFENTFGLELYRDVISPSEELTVSDILKKKQQIHLF